MTRQKKYLSETDRLKARADAKRLKVANRNAEDAEKLRKTKANAEWNRIANLNEENAKKLRNTKTNAEQKRIANLKTEDANKLREARANARQTKIANLNEDKRRNRMKKGENSTADSASIKSVQFLHKLDSP